MRLTRSFALAAAMLVAIGCNNKRVARIDPNSVTDLSGRWNDVDSRLVANALITQSLSAPWVARHTAASGGGAPGWRRRGTGPGGTGGADSTAGVREAAPKGVTGLEYAEGGPGGRRRAMQDGDFGRQDYGEMGYVQSDKEDEGGKNMLEYDYE